MTDEQKKLVEDNLKLVRYISSKFVGSCKLMDADDLFQVGCEGLIYAATHFDKNTEVKFSSYAYPCIEGRIKREIDEKESVVRVPNNIGQKLRSWKNNKTKENLEQFIERTGLNKDCVLHAYNALLPPVSLDAPIMHESEWNSFKEFIEDESANTEKLAIYRSVHEIVSQLLRDMEAMGYSAREIDILKKRMGFETEAMSLEEIGNIYGISRERVRQIEQKMLRKLRYSSFSKKDGLDYCMDACNEYDFSDYV